MNKEELDDVFLNVRRAYRLLFGYQTKLLSLIKFIGNELSYSFNRGTPIFSENCPTERKALKSDNAWDWLNLYNYAFLFEPKQINQDSVYFEIEIYSDTGWYDSEENDDTGGMNLEIFNSEEESETKLLFFISKQKYYHELLNDIQADRSYIYWKFDKNRLFLDKKKQIVAKSYNLSEFVNEDKTREKIIDFINLCKKEGIQIK